MSSGGAHSELAATSVGTLNDSRISDGKAARVSAGQQLIERTSVKPAGVTASVYLASVGMSVGTLIEAVNGRCLT